MLAQDEARHFQHNYIGSEHVLLGVLREEEGLGSRVLSELGVTIDELRGWIRETVGMGDAVVTGQIPFTPRAKKVLELALREALSLGHNYIGTEHVLLGLVRENEGMHAKYLEQKGITAEHVRDMTIQKLSRPGSRNLDPEEQIKLAIKGIKNGLMQVHRSVERLEALLEKDMPEDPSK